MHKAILAADMTICCSHCQHWQVPIHFSANVRLAHFIDTTALRVSTRFCIALYSSSSLTDNHHVRTQLPVPKSPTSLKLQGIPYVQNVAKAAAQMGKNKKNAEELCESLADTIVVIDDLVRMHGEEGTSSYIDICGEMEGYLQRIAQDINDFKLRHRGLRGVFCVDDFRDAIQAYRRRVDDLKTDFLIHSVGDCNSKVTQMHCLLMNGAPQAVVHHPEELVFRIPKRPIAITAFFFV
ncbi:hypothetical protein F5146DRAFT_1167016 [Armillaria mellea]|nr:hypothetical protein F5146DRAFT_1167016 [Armillaria mellea]